MSLHEMLLLRSYENGSGWNDAYLEFSHSVPLDFQRDDTMFHACTTNVQHVTGFQEKYGGDTTRLCVLDRYGGWYNTLKLWVDSADLSARSAVTSDRIRLSPVPDTLRPNGEIELQLTFDMNGLFDLYVPTGNQDTHLRLHPERVQVIERP